MSLIKKIAVLFRKKLRIKDKGKCNSWNVKGLNSFSKAIIKIEYHGNNNNVCIEDASAINKLKIIIFGDNNYISIKKSFRINSANIYCGNDLNKADNTKFEVGSNLSVTSNLNVYLYNSNNKCIVGDNCMFAQNITIRCGEMPHIIYDTITNQNMDISDGVVIGDHVWIGDNSYIMKRTNIPSNSIVGAAAVVTKSFDEENVLIAGNPARICKRNISWGRSLKDKLRSKI